MPKPTPSAEDYLENIYGLIQTKGYARAVEIADALDIRPSSVTKMIQRLDEQGYLVYERYRGITLTELGERVAKRMARRHRLLERFLRLLGIDEATVQRDVEGIEHYISPTTIDHLVKLVSFLEANPQTLEAYRRHEAPAEEEIT
jgi:Mn-dependent DtxR family transcriptional regulator